jgi:DNA polymerase III subunit delta
MMAPASSKTQQLVLVCGEDDFAVKQRTRHLWREWCSEAGNLDQEIIEGSAATSGEALAVLGRLREALQTLPFFGSGKVIWLRGCNFLGDERAAGAQAVTASLASLAQLLKEFQWTNVRLMISAGKVDRRKSFYKTLEKIGRVESFAGWSLEDRNWSAQAEEAARAELAVQQKAISAEALRRLVECVGPNSRQLHMELEKLVTYAGKKSQIDAGDVDAVVTRNKQSRAFALGDALGERNLPKLLRALDEELWEVKRQPQKSEIGLLYGLISKVRTMIFLKEMGRAGWVRAGTDFNRFKAQLERVPAGELSEDKRLNPLAMNPYVLFKAMEHASRYSLDELVAAMDLLLICNQQLVLSGLDEKTVLHQALVKIISGIKRGQLG